MYICGIIIVFALITAEEIFGFFTYSGKALALIFGIDTAHEKMRSMINLKASKLN